MNKLEHLLDDDDFAGYLDEKHRLVEAYQEYTRDCIKARINKTVEPMWPESLYGYTKEYVWSLTI